MAKRQFKYVGHNVARVDGFEKVTGQAKFVGDITVPGMLYGKILRSTYPHARHSLHRCDSGGSAAGVVAVLTAADIGDLNPIYNGRPVIAMNKVRYIGEPVAAVAAEDLATAEEALVADSGRLRGIAGGDRHRCGDRQRCAVNSSRKAGNIGTHEKVLRGDVEKASPTPMRSSKTRLHFPWSIIMRWSRIR